MVVGPSSTQTTRLPASDASSRPTSDSRLATAITVAFGVRNFEDLAQGIAGMVRVLRPGGYLVIGLNDHFYEEGSFPAKLQALEIAGLLTLVNKEHGAHLENVEGSTGWVFVHRKG